MKRTLLVVATVLALTGCGGEAPRPEGASVDLVLTNIGPAKIAVIREVRTVTGLGLKEALDLVNAAPVTVKSGLPRAEAEAALKRLKEAGATAELR